jgi:hypothetical protein
MNKGEWATWFGSDQAADTLVKTVLESLWKNTLWPATIRQFSFQSEKEW